MNPVGRLGGAAATADTISTLKFSAGLAARGQYEIGLTDHLVYVWNCV